MSYNETFPLLSFSNRDFEIKNFVSPLMNFHYRVQSNQHDSKIVKTISKPSGSFLLHSSY